MTADVDSERAEPPLSNIELFNTAVGLVFAQLYAAFPTTINIDEHAIATAMNMIDDEVDVPEYLEPQWQPKKLSNGEYFSSFLESTLEWLIDEGLVRGYREMELGGRVVLTSKALLVMNATPSGLAPRESSIGSKLGAAAKNAGTTAGRAAIGDLVGQVIGGLTRSLFG